MTIEFSGFAESAVADFRRLIYGYLTGRYPEYADKAHVAWVNSSIENRHGERILSIRVFAEKDDLPVARRALDNLQVNRKIMISYEEIAYASPRSTLFPHEPGS